MASLSSRRDRDTPRMKRFFVSLAKAVFYVVRERKRIWSSRPSLLVILSSIVDGLIVSTLALGGIWMTPLAPSVVAGILATAIVLALVMDQIKVWLFARFKMA